MEKYFSSSLFLICLLLCGFVTPQQLRKFGKIFFSEFFNIFIFFRAIQYRSWLSYCIRAFSRWSNGHAVPFCSLFGSSRSWNICWTSVYATIVKWSFKRSIFILISVAYRCANGGLVSANMCMISPLITNVNNLITQANSLAASGQIDPVSNLNGDRVFIFHGTMDFTVVPGKNCFLIFSCTLLKRV